MENKKFLASSTALLKWIRRHFPWGEQDDMEVKFSLVKKELMIDGDGTTSMQVEHTYDFDFAIPMSRLHILIQILQCIDDQPVCLFITESGRVAIEGISI